MPADTQAPKVDDREFEIIVCGRCSRPLAGATGCLGTIEQPHPPTGGVRLRVRPASFVASLEGRVRELDGLVELQRADLERLRRSGGHELCGDLQARIKGLEGTRDEWAAVFGNAPFPSAVEARDNTLAEGARQERERLSGEFQERIVDGLEFFLSSAEKNGDPEPYGMRTMLNRAHGFAAVLSKEARGDG